MAFDSVEHIMRDVNYGWLLRYLHSNGASMFFVAVYVHIFRGMYYGSYKAPREVLWIIGVLIYLVMMATAFMGYVLPWGQMSFWGAKVITNLFSAIPFFGESPSPLGCGEAMRSTIRHSTDLLSPLSLALRSRGALVGLHIWALHVPGNNNPTGVSVKSGQDTVPFHPYYTMKDGFAIVVFLLVLYALFVFFLAELSGSCHQLRSQANPLATPSHIVPQWYYLPFYAILRAIPDKLGGVARHVRLDRPFFLFLPWLDTSKVPAPQPTGRSTNEVSSGSSSRCASAWASSVQSQPEAPM